MEYSRNVIERELLATEAISNNLIIGYSRLLRFARNDSKKSFSIDSLTDFTIIFTQRFSRL